jgi:hypothetical protein
MHHAMLLTVTVKVKITLEQAMKTQRESTVIDKLVL